jgi:adenosylmethionine-8-amino-7-oxononanoate aminotransferase
VELAAPVDVAQVQERAIQAGVWLRPFRNLVYTMPAYCSTADEVAQITAAIAQSIAGD